MLGLVLVLLANTAVVAALVTAVVLILAYPVPERASGPADNGWPSRWPAWRRPAIVGEESAARRGICAERPVR
jgi:hypothetical protein